jgi:hypothetical protein
LESLEFFGKQPAFEVGDAVSIRGKMKLKTYAANDGTTKISRPKNYEAQQWAVT